MNRQVNVILALKDKFSAPLLKAADTAKSLDKKTYDGMRRTNKLAKDMHKGFGRGLKNFIKWGKRAAITAGAISFKKGVEGLKELDYMARKVKSIAGEQLDFDYIKDQMMSIKGMTGQTYEEIGDSWYNAISASVPVEDSLKAVEKAYQLSKAGFTDNDAAMNLLATTMNTFGLKGEKEWDRIADVFLTTQDKGIIIVDEMAHLFGQVSPITNALGMSLEEQSAAIALLTRKGLEPTKAITGYGRLLDRFLTKTGKDAAAVLESAGLDENFFSAEYLKEKGFVNAMKELKEAVGDDPDLISKLFPNINAKLAAQTLLSDIEGFEEVYKDMLDSDGALDYAFMEMTNSLSERWKIFRGKLSEINERFYEKQSGAIGDLLKDAWKWLDENEERILDFLEELNEKIEKLIKKVIKLVKFLWKNKDFFIELFKILVIIHLIIEAVDRIEKVTETFGKIKDALKGLKDGLLELGFSPKKLILLAIAIYLVIKAIRYLRKNWDRIKKEYPNIAGIIEFLGEVLKGFGEIITEIVIPAIKWLWKKGKKYFGKFIKVVFRMVETVAGYLLGLAKIIKGFAKSVAGTILGLITGDFELLEEGLDDIGEGISDILLTTARAMEDEEAISRIENIKKAITEPLDWDEMVNEEELETATGRVGLKFLQFGEKLKKVLKGMIRIIRQAVKTIVKIIVGLIATIVGLISGLFTGDFSMAKDGFDMMGEGFADMWLEVYDIINDGKLDGEKIDEQFRPFWESISKGASLFDELRSRVEEFKETISDNEYLQLAREAWEQFSEWFKNMFSGIANFVIGLLKIVLGIIIFVIGLVTVNFERMEQGIEMATDGAKQAWEGFEEIVRTLIPKPKINGEEVSVFKGLVENTKTAWANLKKKIEENPIVGTITRVWKDDTHHEGRKAKSNRRIFGKKAGNTYKGTTNWKGGWTYLHERGGEVYDLPDGTRVYPHDRSVAMAYDKGYDEAIAQAGQNQGGSGGSSGNNIEIGGLHFYGDINNQGDIDEIGTQIATAVKKALANT